jgi:hypothetical protein
MIGRFSRKLRTLLSTNSARNSPPGDRGQTSTSYWTEHNVTPHHAFSSQQESLDYFHWRNDQYFNYVELMPVSGFDGQGMPMYCGRHASIDGCYRRVRL